MGGGSYSSETYKKSVVTRSLTGVGDFAYSASKPTTVHPNLDPLRINKKPLGKLESRDSDEHPNSTPIIISFDVTGSNIDRARIVQKKLNELMEGLTAVIPDPQISIFANDDITVWQTGKLGAAVQAADFESDNRVDEHLLNLILVGNGGGNRFESYDLVLYAAAYKTALDSIEKRGKKGYLFLYADEPFPTETKPDWVEAVFGDKIEAAIPIEKLIEDARKLYNVYVLWPDGGYTNARDQYRSLLGKEFVMELQDPDAIVEAITSRVKIDAEKEAEALAAVK
jgi:hypothetical protein